ncbi:uncharacterized protein PFL1_03575 [Pseudozyma flocculosa PF-1]|uniref:Related to BOR1 - boron efflux transporter n=2 Tax=Pseudozyma flocculosa TaxID=84751 RepID=A0A5C3F625_9BASI|nr:uncharacterized protein PFL1_03575 [Pseudozyma flocculosa PF-1]EPQ28772.1 hypothetical protein PFL1_03575 [Pseudozyma flocculosa PF-1]SPO39446.1 related to BOR1 - boron efflux transporter [Pseudozyma flocculosa]
MPSSSPDRAAAPIRESATARSSLSSQTTELGQTQAATTATSSSQQFATTPSSSAGLHSRKPQGASKPHPDHVDVGAAHQHDPPRHPTDNDEHANSYPLFAGDKPWSQRSWAYELTPFRGMWYDVRRRSPFLRHDWTSAFEPRNWWTIVNSVFRMYFINLMPAIAYVIDMNYRTNGAYGINEVILASALAAIVFPIFSVQPLTFVGVTGLINLVNYTQYNIFVGYYNFSQIDYLRIQAWSLIWSAAFHWVVAVFNVCDFTRFITDMTSETFGFYVGIVYIQKGIELLIEEFKPAPLDNATGWFSVTIAILFTVSVYLVSKVGATSYLPFRLRNLVGSYAFTAGILFWTGFSHFPDYSLRRIPIERLPITRSWFPTMDRPWFIDFWNIELKYVFVGAPLGFLIMLLFYFDHNVSSVMAQARRFPVRTPAGFHWDFFLLGVTTLVAGFLGLPAPNGLVPQAPVHTETLSVFKQVDKPDEEQEVAMDKPVQRGEKRGRGRAAELPTRTVRRQHVVNTRVVEQRVSHLAVGLLTLGTMTRPLLVALGTMPKAVFAGVFVLVGWASIERNNITMRTLAIFRDRQMMPADEPLAPIRRRKIALWVGIQWLFFAMTIAISQTIAGIGFPVIITLLIPFRYFVVPRWFSPLELKVLDAPTSDADVVLASLGHETERVTGRGVEVALDTGIAGDLYDGGKKRDDDSYGDDGNQAAAGALRSQHGGAAASEKTVYADAEKSVGGVGGHRPMHAQDEGTRATGPAAMSSGIAAGTAGLAADEAKEESKGGGAASTHSGQDHVLASQPAGQQSDQVDAAILVQQQQQQQQKDEAKRAKEAEVVAAQQRKAEEKRAKEEKKAGEKRVKDEKKRAKDEEKQRKKAAKDEEKRRKEDAKREAAEAEREKKAQKDRDAALAAGVAGAATAAATAAGGDAAKEEGEDKSPDAKYEQVETAEPDPLSSTAPQISADVLPVPGASSSLTPASAGGDRPPRLSTSSSIKRKAVPRLSMTDEEPQAAAIAEAPAASIAASNDAAATSWSNPTGVDSIPTSPATTAAAGKRGKRHIVAIENPVRGAGSPPPPVQWRNDGESDA